MNPFFNPTFGIEWKPKNKEKYENITARTNKLINDNEVIK